ncbi:hypothetical protein [Kaistia sp. MMO-174]|uniref:hypothetical protein n=1 Tax=Kaistia sp. MMO-174 TaxID=3081256 RepID=UPI003015CFB8
MTTATPQIETLWTEDGEAWAALIIDPPAGFVLPSQADFITAAREQAKIVSLDLDEACPDGDFPEVETHWVVRSTIDPDIAQGMSEDETEPRYWWGKEGDDDAVMAIGMRFTT